MCLIQSSAFTSNDGINYRIMRTFNFTLLAVLSYVAVIAATPLGNGAPAAIARRQGYVPFNNST